MTEHVSQLSPVVQDYLKVIWQAAEWGGRPATTSSLAARFGTTQANVSDTLRRLADAGLVVREPYRPVALTTRGERFALTMVRRHRLIETYLVSALGYAYTEVHDDAERLEHAASDTFIERIDALLDHPITDPHGDPIPTPAGEVNYPPVAIAAGEATPGVYRVVRISDADSTALADLYAHRIHAGTRVTVAERGGALTVVTEGPDVLSASEVAQIWLAPIDA